MNLLFAPSSSFAKKPALWLNNHGISALAIGVYATKETPADQSRIPIEYITKACAWLKQRGYQKIGTLGLSFGAEMGLYAATICQDITLTIAISGYDRVFEGVLGRGTQYPSGKSSYIKDGKDVPFQSLGLTKDGYIKRMAAEKKSHGENYGRGMWEEAIQKDPNDAAIIPVDFITPAVSLKCTHKGSQPDVALSTFPTSFLSSLPISLTIYFKIWSSDSRRYPISTCFPQKAKPYFQMRSTGMFLAIRTAA